jgi:Leucine-rich repeat (LRR) protein
MGNIMCEIMYEIKIDIFNKWYIDDFNKWCENGRPINENIIMLDISNSNIKNIGNLENLVNLEYLDCSNNKLTSLEEIKKLTNLKELCYSNNFLTSLEGIENFGNLQSLYCNNNQLTSLEGIENLVKLIKNNKKILYTLQYNFIDSDDYIELNNLLDNLIKCKTYDKLNEYIEEIEQMIIKYNNIYYD